MPRVLVTDGQERSVLAACRSLRRAGYSVDAAASEHPAATHWSRFCGRRFSVGDPRADPAAFVEELKAIVGEGEYDVLIPGTDASLLAISTYRHGLDSAVQLGLPPPAIVERSISKVALIEAAAKGGLATPETAVCDEPEAALEAAQVFGYPVMLKPHHSVFEQDGVLRQHRATSVPDEPSLQRLVSEYPSPWLVQRMSAGSVLSFGGVLAEGRLLAYAASRYARTWPADAGSVSFSETVSPDPELLDKVPALVAAIGWEGIFELELVETRDRGSSVIDFNPRVYGSLALAGSAGAPLAVIWAEWLEGRESRVVAAHPGYRYRFEDAELRNLWGLLRQGRILDALSLIRPRRHSTRAHFWPSDPLPVVARAIVLLRHALRRHVSGRK